MNRCATEKRRETAPGRIGRGLGLIVLCLAGCATVGGDPGQPLVPTRHQARTGPFVVYSGVEIGPKSPLVRALVELERNLSEVLGLRVGDGEPPVEVYVLRDRSAFTQYLTFHHPELPPRRAFFLAKGSQRLIYTFFNDRLEEDLRHEATHAVLHATVGDLPLWLDEGLAEYFEVAKEPLGRNPEHVARLPDDLKTGWRPDLRQLETLGSVAEMSPRDYRESWAWVHFLLEDSGPGRSAVLAYLADLREDPGRAEPLSTRLGKGEGGSTPRMLAHFEEVRTGPVAASGRPEPVASSKTPDAPKVLFQNATLDPAEEPRRSLLSRVLGFFRPPTRGIPGDRSHR